MFDLNHIKGSSKNASNQSNTGLAALQNMMMGQTGSSSSSMRGSGNSGNSSSASSHAIPSGTSAKEIYAQTQAFFKEQQKLLQQLPPNSVQRKTYEAILAEMKQAAEQK